MSRATFDSPFALAVYKKQARKLARTKYLTSGTYLPKKEKKVDYDTDEDCGNCGWSFCAECCKKLL